MEFTVSFNPWIVYLFLSLFTVCVVSGFNGESSFGVSTAQKVKDVIAFLILGLAWPVAWFLFVVLAVYWLLND